MSSLLDAQIEKMIAPSKLPKLYVIRFGREVNFFAIEKSLDQFPDAEILAEITSEEAAEWINENLPYQIAYPEASRYALRRWLNHNTSGIFCFWQQVCFKNEQEAAMCKLFFA